MKAYSFYFNASDWLASQSVKQMSLAERGAYIGLLAFAWGSERPGTLPISTDKVRRLAEMSVSEWAESGEVLLEMFPLSACGSYRYNPRLLTEAAKEQARSEKNSEAGRKSAEKRATDRLAVGSSLQPNGNQNPTSVEINPTSVEKTGNENPTISKVKDSNKEPMPISATPSSAGSVLKAEKDKEKELDFTSFWLAYHDNLPKRGSKSKAKAKWQTLSAATRTLILAGLVAHRLDATHNGPSYLPYATTFLSEQRWEWETFGTVSPTNALPKQPTAKQDFPNPGQELPGQVFYIAGRPGDYNMDKMAAESCLKHFPSSKVVSLAFPQVPYTMKDGNVIRG